MTRELAADSKDRGKHPGATAVCTIVSKNYLAYARTLMQSVANVHPTWKRYVLLVDEVDGAFEPQGENFEVVSIADLPLPDAKKFLFRYDVLELNTAVKPWYLQWLFERTGIERVVYFDPDIKIYSALSAMEKQFDAGALMTLTPHLTASLNDHCHPSDLDILRAGTFNLGFLALSRHPELPRFLSWWQSKLTYDCRIDVAQGIFVDQKWMDLAPSLFDDVAILREPGYNVAYWNLAHRPIRVTAGGPKVGAAPLVFFHFSGLDPRAPGALSKHQDRFQLADLPECAKVVNAYCAEVIANGWNECKNWPYAYGYLKDGTPINKTMRSYYRNHPEIIEKVGGDPFAQRHEYLNHSAGAPKQPLVTILMRALWEGRPDLRDAFPDIEGASRVPFIHHFLHAGAEEAAVADRFVWPVRESLANFMRSDHSVLFRICNRLRPLVARCVPAPLRRCLRRLLLGRTNEKQVAQEVPEPEIISARMRWNGTTHESSRQIPANIKLRTENRSCGETGLSIVGYFQADTGVGQSARLSLQSAQAVGLSTSIRQIAVGGAETAHNQRLPYADATDANQTVNLLHVNADQMANVRGILGESFFADRYTIGVWHWELPKLPQRWWGAFDLVDEIWAPSRFVQDCLTPQSPKPVVKIPHAIRFDATPGITRRDFGLPEDDFLFVMMYDVQSFQERKNPRGAIEAFRKAFAGSKGVRLVIKVNDSNRQVCRMELPSSAWQGVDNVHVIDETMNRQRAYDLLSVCDCALSLHRSEGFGLVLAEAMFLGKSVIATGWSGNMEFMNERNSFPVCHRLTRLEHDVGPYERGQFWADPDIDHAAELMREVAKRSSLAQTIAQAGRTTIRDDFSPERIGGLYLERLKVIMDRRSSTDSVIRVSA